MKTVYLGMSGGVDSGVSAAILKQQGYRVVGVYMKNWSKNLPGMQCPWAEDLADAKRIATGLDIDFKVFDFEKEYKQRVVDYMLDEYKKGNTPNPDIMCNQEVKFRLFADKSFADGADLIATGHYAKMGEIDGRPALMRAKDDNKDQTYFLYRAPIETLARTLFPIGNLTKPEVKTKAAEFGLHIVKKPESMGICFIGEADIQDFLAEFIDIVPGDICQAETGEVIGEHDGAILYTLGQRHGLYLGGGLPYYVVGKDIQKNIVYVSQDLNHPNLWADKLELTDLIWRGKQPVENLVENSQNTPVNVLVRLRHRAPLIPAKLKGNTIYFDEAIRRPAPGQSAVLYDDQVCLGGGIICN